MPPHFTPATLQFLRGLRRNNDRTWFNDRKHLYEANLKAPMLELITAVNERLAPHAPDHLHPPAKIMLRIYRDIRFSTDKRPYKHHISAWWARAGMHKTSGAGFYLQLSPDELLLAAGLYMPPREQLLATRNFLVEHAADLRKALASPAARRLGLTPIDGQPLTRMPKGLPPDHPHADLLRQQQWGLSITLPATAALEPDLPTVVARYFRAALPAVNLLNQPLVPNRKPLVDPLAF